MQPRFLFSLLSTAIAFACQAPRAEAPRSQSVPLEAAPLRYATRLISRAETLAIRNVEDSAAGLMVLRLQATDDQVLSTIDAFSHHSLLQHIEAAFDPQSLEPRHVHETRRNWQATLTYSGNRLRGSMVTTTAVGSHDTVRVDRPIAPGVLDRRVLFHVTPWLPLAEEHVFTVRIYDVDAFGTYPVRIKTGARARVVVPSGTFDAYRVEMTAGERGMICPPATLVPSVLYISTDSLRLVLRVERPHGQTFDLIGWGIP